jgi:hypothetical protein
VRQAQRAHVVLILLFNRHRVAFLFVFGGKPNKVEARWQGTDIPFQNAAVQTLLLYISPEGV